MTVHRIYDSGGSVLREWWFDDADGRWGHQTHAPMADGLLEIIRDQRAENKRFKLDRSMQKICSVPIPMLEKWLHDNGLELHQLNDPDVESKLFAHVASEWPHLMASDA